MQNIGKVSIVVIAVFTVFMLLIIKRKDYRFIWLVWRRFRIRMFFESVFVVILTVVLAVLMLKIPFLDYGWVKFFFGSNGNMIITPVLKGSESASVLVRLMVPIFLIIFLISVPFFAHSEEESYRRGYRDWKSIAKQSVKFGLMHCISGVPIACGLALTVSGLLYGLKYKNTLERNEATVGNFEAENEAIMVSTAYHTMYNTILVTGILLTAIVAV